MMKPFNGPDFSSFFINLLCSWDVTILTSGNPRFYEVTVQSSPSSKLIDFISLASFIGVPKSIEDLIRNLKALKRFQNHWLKVPKECPKKIPVKGLKWTIQRSYKKSAKKPTHQKESKSGWDIRIQVMERTGSTVSR
jgi:hypothetical protein